MTPRLSSHLLWLAGTICSLLLWLGANVLQQNKDEQQQRQQQLHEAELLADNVANQLHYALLAGQAATELLLAKQDNSPQSTFQRYAPFVLADNSLFDYIATVRRLEQRERLPYELGQAVILREYHQGKLAPAQSRPLYFPLEQQYPEDSKSLPGQLDLASQASVAKALQQVDQNGRPAIALIRAGNASRLAALFSAKSHPLEQLIVMGIRPDALLAHNSSQLENQRHQSSYRLRIQLKEKTPVLILDSQGIDSQPPQTPPVFSSARAIGGQQLVFELYPLRAPHTVDNLWIPATLLLAMLVMAIASGLIVRHTQRGLDGQRKRLQAQGNYNQELKLKLQQQQMLQQEDHHTIQRLRAIVEGSGDAILVISAHGHIRDMNCAAETMLGQTRNILLGLPAGALISELQPLEPALGFAHHITPRIGRPFDALMICKASQMLQIEVSLSFAAIDHDAIYIALCRDISARKASEAALIQLNDSLFEQVETQSQQLSALLDASPMAMAYIVDRQFKQVNHAFLQLFQHRESDVIGQSTRMLYRSDEHFTRTGNRTYTELFTGEVSQSEVLLERGHDSPIWAHMYGKAVSLDKPELGSVWLYQDVSAQRRTEETLRHAKELAEENSRAKTEFLANMSHELRTPMHAILGFAEVGEARTGSATPDKLRQYFSRIHSSGKRLLSLLNDLLDLSKMEAGKMDYQLLPCDVIQLTRDAVDELRGMAQKQHLSLQLATPDNEPLSAQLDAMRYGQIVRNLLGNAIKFSPASGQIDISISTYPPEPQLICLSIRDYGPGIPENEREQVFNSFIQGSLTKTGAGGTGLGLAICREIVHAHQGRIDIMPLDGPGALFRVLLPRQPQFASRDNRHDETTITGR